MAELVTDAKPPPVLRYLTPFGVSGSVPTIAWRDVYNDAETIFGQRNQQGLATITPSAEITIDDFRAR